MTDLDVERLADGRALSPFDEEVVATVAGLLRRVRDARARVDNEGSIIDDGKGFPVEHPALKVERQASAELRGWVDKRPDLFGKMAAPSQGQKSAPVGRAPGGLSKFQVV